MAKSADRWQHLCRLMRLSLQSAFQRGLFFAALCGCTACGATGLDWVGEAHLESARQQHVTHVTPPRTATVGVASTSSIPATTEPSESESRPRLSRTITLGEIDVVSTRDGAAPAAAPGPSVTVNNYNHVNVVTPAYGYASYGYARSQPSFSTGSSSPSPSRSGSGLQPGQNWPAIPDHGPSFPYGSAPASPWTRTR